MGKRLGFLIVCVMVVMALCAPAALAAITVTSVTPAQRHRRRVRHLYSRRARTGSTTCSSTHWRPPVVQARQRGDRRSTAPPTAGHCHDASVTFSLPLDGPQATYDLEAAQGHKLTIDPLYTKDDHDRSPMRSTLYVRPAITCHQPDGATVGSAASL